MLHLPQNLNIEVLTESLVNSSLVRMSSDLSKAHNSLTTFSVIKKPSDWLTAHPTTLSLTKIPSDWTTAHVIL